MYTLLFRNFENISQKLFDPLKTTDPLSNYEKLTVPSIFTMVLNIFLVFFFKVS